VRQRRDKQPRSWSFTGSIRATRIARDSERVELMARFSRIARAALLTAVALAPVSAYPQDRLKLAVGAPNNWDSGIPDIGQRAGIFKKHGLDLDILYTNGGGETLQAVISGSVDIGISAGTGGVMGAFAKGAPVRIILAGTTGASDLYWYVPAASPLKSFADLDGKTVAYSTNGASTHITLLAPIKHFNVAAKPVSTGAAALTLTQAMSGQIDVGWASPPFGLDALDDGKIRLIARGSDAPSTRDHTVRVHIANADALAKRHDAIERFVAAYREAYDWLYDSPEGVKLYAAYGKVSEHLATRIRDEFLPKPAMSPDRVSGIDSMTRDAVEFKFLPAPLSREQLAELIRIPPPAK
jgi:NitT/TauT family transport system substrate-binding protein